MMQGFKPIRRNSAAMIVRRELIKLIKADFFKDGTLPSEDGIAAMFGVSRVTVRDALANLENLGYISRLQGRGTRVNQNITEMTGRVSEGQPFTELIRSQGFTPSVSHGKAEKRPITPEMQEKLCTAATEMYQIEKLFLGDGSPMIFSTNYFSTDYLNDEILTCPMDETLIFTLIQKRFNFPDIAYDIVNILPRQADARIASLLQINAGSAILMFESTSFSREQRPILVNHEFYHPDKMRFCEMRTADYHMN